MGLHLVTCCKMKRNKGLPYITRGPLMHKFYMNKLPSYMIFQNSPESIAVLRRQVGMIPVGTGLIGDIEVITEGQERVRGSYL